MWNNYQATKIQNFYRTFIKCDRDKTALCKIKIVSNHKRKYLEIPSPIDPIYRIPYEEKNHIRITEWIDVKKPIVWHFNILSLIDWLNTAKKWTNPMTNCLFMNKSIDRIMEFIDKNSVRKKIKIKIEYNKNEPTF